MKPNFALHFTDDSIALLHRTRRGWAEIGSTPVDSDDLAAALADLRQKAEALAPAGITTKLVIPNSQIKYLDIAAPGPDAGKRRAQIAAALEGQTPYDVADLVWDHWGKGPTVRVAVLARETLDEAEGFAIANGFNPVSFVAIPEDASFGGEPWFGPAAHAATLLKPGEKVERDQDPIRRASVDEPTVSQPDPAPAAQVTAAPPEPEPEAQPLSPEASDSADLAVTEALPDLPADAQIVMEPAPADPMVNDPTPVEPTPAEAMPADPMLPLAGPLKVDLAGLIRPEAPQSETPVDPAKIAATLAASEPPAPSVLDAAIPDPDEAPMAIDVAEETIDARAALARRSSASVLIDPSVEDDLPPIPSGAALSAYGRRDSDLAADLPQSERLPPRAASGPAVPVAAPPRKEGKAERPAGVRPPPKFSYETPGEKPATPASKAMRGIGALVTAPSIPGGRKVKVAPPAAAPLATAAAAPAGGAAAPASTTTAKRPAGLGSRPMPVRGKPRHLGLILTGLLLIMLALAAGLSTFYVSWRDQATEAATDVAAADPSAPAISAPEEVLPAPEDEMLADLQDPGDLVPPPEDEAAADGVVMQAIDPNAAPVQPPAAEDLAAAAPAAAPVPEAPPEAAPAAVPEPAPEPAPQTTVATGDPARSAPNPEPQDEIFLAASDSAPRTVDPVALPIPSAQGDPPPDAQLPPPPFGTVYQFDENGLIRATPEGIVTPEGVLLTAGRPARVPPERPAAIAEAAAAAAIDAALAARNADPAAAAPATETSPEGETFVIPADPALADNRPLARPATLAPPAAEAETATDDDAALSPELASRLAGLRPAARPGTLAAEAVAAGLLAPATASNNGSLALVAPEGTVTPLGLAISRRPAARPEDMNRAVEEAVAAAIRQLDPVPEPQDDAPYAVEENEPEVASAAPRIPTTANVAKQATLRNAIDLGDINLIGVYGTSAERYALVRNPNGRYIKVEVGDRLDGGRVAAITASELRYEKRGRMVVLELPNS